MEIISVIFQFLISPIGILSIGIISILYLWGTYINGTFVRRGISHLKPVIFFGNTLPIILNRQHFMQTSNTIYYSFPNESVIGFMQFMQPLFIVRDTELIREITVKHFDNFRNKMVAPSEDVDPVFGRTLASMKDHKWKITRNLLTPVFTGSKIRIMFKLMSDCADRTIHALEEKMTKRNNQKSIELEMKDFFTRFTNDTIATTVFGIEVNSIEDPDNEFYKMCKQLTNFSFPFFFKLILSFAAPWVLKLLKVNILDTKATRYFVDLVKSAISYRLKNNIERHDFLNTYIENIKEFENNDTATEEDLHKKWNLDDFVSQCFSFFFAGYETTATLFMFMSYELALNPDIQEKLINEIDTVRGKNNDSELNYEMLQDSKFLDMVVNETGRKWPVIPVFDRICTEDITLYGSNGKPYFFKKGDNVNIPTIGVHRDPTNFYDPDKFIPDRFSPEKKQTINAFTYLTFGVGPRVCIANRLALTECKCIFYKLLSKFKLEMYENTQHPLQFKKNGFGFVPEKGLWLKLISRTNT